MAASAADARTPIDHSHRIMQNLAGQWKHIPRDMVSWLVEKGVDASAILTSLVSAEDLAWVLDTFPGLDLDYDPSDHDDECDEMDPVNWHPMNSFAGRGMTEHLRVMLDHGVPADGYKPDELTPLYTALEHGYLEAAALLLERGARRRIPDADVIIYEERASLEVVKFIFENGIEFDDFAGRIKKMARFGDGVAAYLRAKRPALFSKMKK